MNFVLFVQIVKKENTQDLLIPKRESIYLTNLVVVIELLSVDILNIQLKEVISIAKKVMFL